MKFQAPKTSWNLPGPESNRRRKVMKKAELSGEQKAECFILRVTFCSGHSCTVQDTLAPFHQSGILRPLKPFDNGSKPNIEQNNPCLDVPQPKFGDLIHPTGTWIQTCTSSRAPCSCNVLGAISNGLHNKSQLPAFMPQILGSCLFPIAVRNHR